MTEHAVVIAGGGPAGMMLAAELALAKVDVAVLERRPDHVLVGSRAGGFHSRTIEALDQRGVADRFLAEGQVAQVATFASRCGRCIWSGATEDVASSVKRPASSSRGGIRPRAT